MRRCRLIWLGVLVIGIAIALVAAYIVTLPRNGGTGLRQLPHYKTIRVYDVDALGLSGDSPVPEVPSAQIDESFTRVICQEVSYHRGSRLWKGSLLGIVELDNGDTQRIAISLYGGFFKRLGDTGYYETEGRSRSELDHQIFKILSEDFIPRRRASATSIGEREIKKEK